MSESCLVTDCKSREAPKEADSIWHQIRQTIPSRSAMTASTIVFLTDEIAMEVFHPTDNQLNRKERRKIGRPNRVRSNRVKSYHLVQAQLRRPKVDKSWFLTSTTAKKFQQVDARGSTVNNVGGDQFNIVVNNPTRAHIEEMDEDITTLPVIFSLFLLSPIVHPCLFIQGKSRRGSRAQ